MLATIGCVLALAACGSSNKSNSASKADANDPFLPFAVCMRSHGVPNYPDPRPGGGGIQLGSGVNPSSPSFKAAQAQCRKLMPGGGPSSGRPSAQAKAQMLQISECMRRHGISQFPDPTLTPPSSQAGYSAVVDRGGVALAIPNTIDVASPAFKQAARACGFGH